MTDKSVKDVQGISIFGNDIKYIPGNLGSLFNLKAFEINSANLMEIKSTDFNGMQNLEYLNIGFNTDEFGILTKLKVINLSRNELEMMPNGSSLLIPIWSAFIWMETKSNLLDLDFLTENRI